MTCACLPATLLFGGVAQRPADGHRRLGSEHPDVLIAKLEKRADRPTIQALLKAETPALLVSRLAGLDFEARKDTARAFRALLRSASLAGLEVEVARHVMERPGLIQGLVDGCWNPELALHCGAMVRACAMYPTVTAVLLNFGVAKSLFDIASHKDFDIASDAFSSLRELLLTQKAVAAEYLEANADELFIAAHGFLCGGAEYVTQRQAQGLLGDILFDPIFCQVMAAYVANDRYLQIHMNLLRDSSNSIRLDAFQALRLFVGNPRQPARVTNILCRNRDRLAKLLEALAVHKEGADEDLARDVGDTVAALRALRPPSRSVSKSSVASTAASDACPPWLRQPSSGGDLSP